MSKLYADDSWSLLQSEIHDMPIIIRARSHLPCEADRHILPILVIVTWRYDDTEGGMPSPGVLEQIASFDEAIGSKFEEAGVAIETASITGNSVKEWRFYATSVDAFMSVVNASLVGHAPYPLEFRAYEDLSWGGLAELLPRQPPAA